jgi:predicted phosphodiesterase
MKIAVLSDIHGNSIALKAVLGEARNLGIDQLYILGDCVGYYYHPDKVLALLDDWPVEMIQGNHEGMLRSIRDSDGEEKKIREKYGSGLRFALEKLSDEQVDLLTSLPCSKHISINQFKVLLAHGSPWDRDTYIYPDKIVDVQEKFDSFDFDFVFLGHTHYPFSFMRNGRLIVGVGSVGQARDKGGLASWVFFDAESGVIVFKHTPYDNVSLIEEVKRVDPDVPNLHRVLVRG